MKLLEQRNEWASIGQLALRFGWKPTTIRGWVHQLRSDARLSLDERLSLVIGTNRATRINVWGFFLWLETRTAEGSSPTVIH